jgi:hypothetical protein
MSDQGAPPSGEETAAPENVETTGTQESKEQSYQEKLEQRLEELASQNKTLVDQFGELRESLYTDDDDEVDEDLIPEGEDGYEEQEAQRYLQELAREEAEKLLQPMRVEQANRARDTAFDKLKSNFPEFDNEETARKYVAEAVSILEDLNPAAIEDHRLVYFIEKLYKADKADERAAQETPPQRTAHLEHGGGAAPAGQDESLEDRLMKQLKDAPAF